MQVRTAPLEELSGRNGGAPRIPDVASTRSVADFATDENGLATYVVDVTSFPTLFVLRATAPGFASAEEAVVVESPGPVRVDLIQHAGVIVRGTVVTLGGRSLAGIDVVSIPATLPFDAASQGVHVRGGMPWVKTTTGEDGQFELTIQRGSLHRLRAQSDGWIQQERVSVSGKEHGLRNVKLVVYPVRVARVRLIDSESRDPIWTVFGAVGVYPAMRKSDGAKPRYFGWDGSVRAGQKIGRFRYFDGNAWRWNFGPLEPAAEGPPGIYALPMWWDSEGDVPRSIRLTFIVGSLSVGVWTGVADAALQLPGNAARGSAYDEIVLRRQQPMGPGDGQEISRTGTLVLKETIQDAPAMRIPRTRSLFIPIRGPKDGLVLLPLDRKDGTSVFYNVPEGSWRGILNVGGARVPIDVTVTAGKTSVVEVAYPRTGLVIRARFPDGTRAFGYRLTLINQETNEPLGVFPATLHGTAALERGVRLWITAGTYEVAAIFDDLGWFGSEEVTLSRGDLRVVEVMLKKNN